APELSGVSVPDAAINASGQAIAIWTQQVDGGRVGLRASRYTGAGWSAAITVDTNNPVDAGEYGVDLDATGNATAAWDTYDNNFNIPAHLFVNRFINSLGSYTVQA